MAMACGTSPLWGTHLFLGALMVALPGMTALLVVNLAFGVMSRAAPTLNLFAVGFPVTLIFGLADRLRRSADRAGDLHSNRSSRRFELHARHVGASVAG